MTRAELLSVAKPILFNTQMVRAILEDRKTVTRRVITYGCLTKPENSLDDFIGNSDPQLLTSCAPTKSGITFMCGKRDAGVLVGTAG